MSKKCFCCITAFSLVALVSGCTVGPDFHRPEAPAAAGRTAQPLTATASTPDVAGGEEQRFVKEMNIPQQWWALFESPPLNSLIEKSIKANPTLDAAKAALCQARENVAAQKGFFYPTVQANGSASGQKNATETIAPTLTSGAAYFSLYTAQLTVSYMPDVFGLNRRQVESLEAQTEFQLFQLEAAYLALTSNVVAAAVQEASLRAQIAATHRIIESAGKLLEIQRRHMALGYATGLDVAAQEAALAQVEATLPPLEKQLAQTRDLLAALAGRFPSEEMEEKFDLEVLRLPQDLPLSLPSKLVEQRPDLRAAEAQWHSACAQVGVATANMLPQISITGAMGGASTQIGQMFVPGNTFYNLTGGLTQTIFDAGTLLHKKRAAQAGLNQAAAQYRSTVINAFQNVADTLHALQSDANALKAAVAAERAARRTLDLTRKQLELGAVNYLAVLSAEQGWQQALINLAQARANRFADSAALFLALGGGWWNRADDAIEHTRSAEKL
ncbi:Heavy metal cation tricomponent efflux outer membrane porin HmwC (CzcC-like) [Syntrophobacter sp. SbD1]|nr:Heavy metal cation tricomponent efflux outer membrane porin HmwC (CzcC-like) [Syntrophobacter sp. SbD1]